MSDMVTDRVQRRVKVAELLAGGNSQSAIAAVVGVSQATVSRDIEAIRQGRWQFPVSVSPSKPITKSDVPAAIFPSDNAFDIPVLLPQLQADYVDAPVAGWGSTARRVNMHGTWHFYTDDYRFVGLWADPTGVVNSGCVSVIEPNFSVYDNTPRAQALDAIYRKRYLARLWQSYGIRVFVDLNVSVRHYEDNLLGVPSGWKAYATRGYAARLEHLTFEWELAVNVAKTSDILFLVIGGGKTVQEECRNRGWVWSPDVMGRGVAQ